MCPIEKTNLTVGHGTGERHTYCASDDPELSLANMVLRVPIHNQYVLVGIENAKRKYTKRMKDDIYMITGRIFKGIYVMY